LLISKTDLNFGPQQQTLSDAVTIATTIQMQKLGIVDAEVEKEF